MNSPSRVPGRCFSAACLWAALVLTTAVLWWPRAPASAEPEVLAGGPAVSFFLEPDDGRKPLLEAIRRARESIDVTMYHLTDFKEAGSRETKSRHRHTIVQALVEKARQGVQVRLILDRRSAKEEVVGALTRAGAGVHISSPVFEYSHQKSLLIDGREALILSMNLTPGTFKHTRDYGVITRDPDVVREVRLVFDSDFSLREPPPPLPATPEVSNPYLVWSPVNSRKRLSDLLASARSTVILTTEHFTDRDIIGQLKSLAQGGVDVRIVLPARPAGLADPEGNRKAIEELKALARIRTLTPPYSKDYPYIHGKMMVVDGARAYVGSENLSPTSLEKNRELGILISDPEALARLQSAFDQDFGKGITPPGGRE